MAIQDDFTIDYVNRRITYTTAFVDDRPTSIYTVNQLYSFLQDTFDEPAQMDDPVPMSAQTPTQYTLINGWYMDDESMKALYGGSIQTSGWTKTATDGITQLRWQNGAADAPVAGDIGVTLTGGTSSATGVLLAVNATRQVAWVRNTSAAQFQDNEAVTGTGVSFSTESISGFQTGESVWANVFSVGSLQDNTGIYVGQEDDYMGGRAYHTATPYARRIEKIDEWWDSDVDYTASPNLIGGLGHIDLLIKTQEAGSTIDGSRLAVFSRQFSKVYSSFEFVGGVGNFVVPFASTAADLNSQEGPYRVGFDAGAGGKGQLDIGDVLENDTGTTPVGRLRAVVTDVSGTTNGTFDYYLIGENEPLATTDRTLRQFADNENITVRGDAFTFDIDAAGTAVTEVGPGLAQGITITFADAQVDVDETSGASAQQFACIIDCNNVPLADVYKRVQFLTSRGNQDGTTPDTQDTLLPSAASGVNEAGEFYRAVGDIVFSYDGGIGTQITEGDYVINSGDTASGVVTSVTSGTTGTCVLTQVKGSFADNDVIARPTEHATNAIVVAGTTSSIVDNTAAPFGTFAGGRWFLAQGVVVINVPISDANNWQAIDLSGTTRIPPTIRTITFAGLEANDRAFLAEVDTAGGNDITKNQNTIDGGGVSAGAATITLGTSVALDVPAADSWIRVVDTSEAALGTEYRFYYTAVSGTTVTLDQGANTSGTVTSTGSGTVLNDTGAFTSFGVNGAVKIGMEIINVTDGSRAVVLRKIDNDSIETTSLSGGIDDTWQASDSWNANRPPVALTGSDTCYFPFIDDVSTGTDLSANIKYVANTDLIARARFSDPDVGGTRILPFEQRNITLTDANLTVTAIRTDDTIAS